MQTVNPVDRCYNFAATTTPSTNPVTGSPTQQTHRYHVVNGGAQEVFLVLSRNPNVTAAFPADGANAKGYMLAANSETIIDGPLCGQGNTVYAACVAASGTTNLYLTPVERAGY